MFYLTRSNLLRLLADLNETNPATIIIVTIQKGACFPIMLLQSRFVRKYLLSILKNVLRTAINYVKPKCSNS